MSEGEALFPGVKPTTTTTTTTAAEAPSGLDDDDGNFVEDGAQQIPGDDLR